MKKLKIAIFFLFVTIVSNNGFGQSRIGDKLNKISEEFSEKEYPKRMMGESNGGGYRLYVKTEIGWISFYTNEDSICYLTQVIPVNDSVFYHLIDVYNEDSKKTSTSSWTLFTKGYEYGVLVKLINDPTDLLFKKRGKYFEYTQIKL